jgi:hypothetical protein
MRFAKLELRKRGRLLETMTIGQDSQRYRSDFAAEDLGGTLLRGIEPESPVEGYTIVLTTMEGEKKVVKAEFELTGDVESSPELDQLERQVVAFMGWVDDYKAVQQ